MDSRYTNIPILLCEFALVNRKVNQLKLYIYLKLNSDGYIEFDDLSFKSWAAQIGVSERTIKTSLSWLIKERWLTVNGKHNVIHVISYRKLKKKLNLNFKIGILFEPVERISYLYFRAFCCASVIQYYLGKKRYFERQSVTIKGVANTNCKRNKGFYPMANSYLAKCLGVSLSTACRIKQEAENKGFIETKPSYSYYEDNSGNRIKSDHLEMIKYLGMKNGKPNRYRKGKKYLKLVESDLIHCLLKVKNKQQ